MAPRSKFSLFFKKTQLDLKKRPITKVVSDFIDWNYLNG